MATYVFTDLHPGQGSVARAKTNSIWETVRTGGGGDAASGNYYAGWTWSGSAYSLWQSFMKFDTSSIPANETIVSAGIRLVCSSTVRNASYNVRIRESSGWSYPVMAPDFVGVNDLQGLLGTITVPASGSVALETPVSASYINTLGFTQILLHPQQQELSSAPESDHNISFDGPNFLIVHTVESSTLMGVHDAAVQLSDGSTVYAEGTGEVMWGSSYPETNFVIKRVTSAGDITTLDTGFATDICPNTLQGMTIVANAQDDVYLLIPGSDGIEISRLTASNGWQYDSGEYFNIFSTNVAAVFCDSTANAGAGRILVASFEHWDGQAAWSLINPSNWTVTASGTNPSWMVSSADFRNTSGTGLSLATDVFGGTRVGALAWSNDALTSSGSVVSFVLRGSRLTVGSTISDVISETAESYSSINYNLIRAKVIGCGLDSLVVIWNDNSGTISAYKLGESGAFGNSTFLQREYFDAVYDGVDRVWIYYWSTETDTKLMRRSFHPEDPSRIETPVEVTDFPDVSVRDSIRTVKHLRNPRHVEAHWNRRG